MRGRGSGRKDGEIRTEVKAEIKRQNRRSLFSATSLSFMVWVIIVVFLPYVLDWFHYSGFYTSIEFQGMVSLAVIGITVVDLIGDAVRRS